MCPETVLSMYQQCTEHKVGVPAQTLDGHTWTHPCMYIRIRNIYTVEFIGTVLKGIFPDLKVPTVVGKNPA